MRQTEYANNTPEQVEQYLTDALALTDKLAPPDDLRVAVFENAIRMFSAKQIVMEQVSPTMAMLQNARH
jgi:uncharacterized protein YejL (UPF0352 family)